MKRVYLDANLCVGQITNLQDNVFHYLFRVLRCRNNEEIIVFNGDGNDYIGQLQQNGRKSADISIHQCLENTKESPLHTILLQGLSKGERMDIAIQKAVELGVSEIYPIQTEFSAVKLDEKRLEKKHQHWQAIIQSACEQCGRSIIPLLHSVKPITEAIPLLSVQKKIMLHPYPKDNLTDNTIEDTLLLANDKNIKNVAVLVGAEGGLSDVEVEFAEQHGFSRLQLGERILRTETATISALTLVQFLWGDYVKSPR